jgi:DNA-binding NtrC family response regulator
MSKSSEKSLETILVVEDEKMVRELVRSVLESHGYNVLDAPTGEAALELCQDHTGTIHLLLSDMVMPGMSGPELAKQLKESRSEMKVLYMSGYTEYALVSHGVMERVTSFIWKPFSTEALAAKVREILDSPADEVAG